MTTLINPCKKCDSKKISLCFVRNASGHAFYFYECERCGNAPATMTTDKANALALWNRMNKAPKNTQEAPVKRNKLDTLRISGLVRLQETKNDAEN